MNEKYLRVCEDLEWSIHDDGDGSVTVAQASPAGEDFSFSASTENFVEDVVSYARDFDVDEHVELWIGSRGQCGVPGTVRELVEDAEAIQQMLNDLAEALEEAAESERAEEPSEEPVPMSIEELHQWFDGKDGPIWIFTGRSVWPAILDRVDNKIVAVWAYSETGVLFENDYGVKWTAYRTREEAEQALKEVQTAVVAT